MRQATGAVGGPSPSNIPLCPAANDGVLNRCVGIYCRGIFLQLASQPGDLQAPVGQSGLIAPGLRNRDTLGPFMTAGSIASATSRRSGTTRRSRQMKYHKHTRILGEVAVRLAEERRVVVTRKATPPGLHRDVLLTILAFVADDAAVMTLTVVVLP
jgi:hypothetical protein